MTIGGRTCIGWACNFGIAVFSKNAIELKKMVSAAMKNHPFDDLGSHALGRLSNFGPHLGYGRVQRGEFSVHIRLECTQSPIHSSTDSVGLGIDIVVVGVRVHPFMIDLACGHVNARTGDIKPAFASA